MDKYNQFVEELSIYKNATKNKIKFIILLHKVVRRCTTKLFDFIFSLIIFNGMFALLQLDITIDTVKSSLIWHFVYWILIYVPISRYFKSDTYDLLTLRIRILENMLSEK